MAGIFSSKKKKKRKKAEEEEAARLEAEKQEALDRGDPTIGKASAKAQAAHAKSFGAAVASLFGGGSSGFGETGPLYGGRTPAGRSAFAGSSGLPVSTPLLDAISAGGSVPTRKRGRGGTAARIETFPK